MYPASFPYRLARIRLSAGALFLSALVPLAANASPGADNGEPPIITGVGQIVDGDTLDVGEVRVRLEGIDAPEIAQTCKTATGQLWKCGVEAAAMLRKLAEHQDLVCDRQGRDRYYRTLATCIADGVDIGEEMVRTGMAWAFVKYSVIYVGDEAAARKAKIGVWQGEAEAPWDFRRDEWQVSEAVAQKGCAIKGNVSSRGRIYHMPSDPWYDSINMDLSKGKRWFCNETEAIEAGWRHASAH